MDQRFFWYSGGDPVAMKKIETRAYFHFCAASNNDQRKTWLAFRDAFDTENITKIMCTELEGADPKTIGFSEPDELDQSRIAYFADHCSAPAVRKVTPPVKLDYDHRFMAKLPLAVGYSIFGEEYLQTVYAKELRKAFGIVKVMARRLRSWDNRHLAAHQITIFSSSPDRGTPSL